MPCRDYDYENYSTRTEYVTKYKDSPVTIKKIHKMSAMLCALLTSITNNRGEIEADTLISRSKYPKDLKAWWKKHQKDDKQRLKNKK